MDTNNILFAVIFILIAIFWRILWFAKSVPKSELYYNESSPLMREIISRCKCLNESYIPMYVWGKSGHIQSMVYGTFGRFGKLHSFQSKRCELTATDGSIVSYDMIEAKSGVKEKDEVIVIVPGMGNHGESTYIKCFAQHITTYGYKVAVLNHTGALETVQLTKPRIFTYGQTDDLDLVVSTLIQREGNKSLVAIGFSLGGNILMKYLGEKPERQKQFSFAASICQGYDIPECSILMQDWENLRFLYNFGLTRKMLKVIYQHKHSLIEHCNSTEPELHLNWKRISLATALHELDDEFTVKLSSEKDRDQYYRNSSSSQYLRNIYIPFLAMNAKDDPIIPETLFKYPRQLVDVNPNALFLVTPYGGHMGYFEGGYIIPNHLSWMDRMLAEFIDSTLDVIKQK